MKNKKTIILITTISIILLGVVGIVLSKNLNLLSKLKSSVIDPVTGDVCTEDTNSSNIVHSNGETVKKILDDLYAESNSTCSVGYKCDKPIIPTQVEPESCFTLSTEHIMYSKGNDTITVENALKELYTIYNSAGFCPQKYCNPMTYTVTLDKNGGTTQGTPSVYEKYDTAVYLDEDETSEMTDSENPITKPTKIYSISYKANGQGATYTGEPTESAATFTGYYTEASGGTKMIDENGYIVPANFPNNKYSDSATLYAHYSNNKITLPAITKANATCKWAEGSASGTQYAGGTERTISANTDYYAVCTANPIITVINKRCDVNGSNCTQVSSVQYQKAYGTTETIRATAQSGYNNPGSKSVTYDGNHTLTFNHTAILSVTPVTAVYNSSQLRALHTNGHTDIHLPTGSRSYGYIVPADSSSAIQWPEYSSTSSSTFSGFPNIIVLSDDGNGRSDYVAAFSGSNYSNGVRGTYYVRTCDMKSDNTETCTDAEELRPYIEIKYDLKGGSGTSTTQNKYSGTSITLHGTPTKSGYTFKGWAAQKADGTQCNVCNGAGGACNTVAYYAAGRTLNGQEWNVGNESWPCAQYNIYENNTSTVYLRALWNRNAWIDYN